jgi:4-diphosphocytidyl-2-C-methyl-D-erythritol kinase
MMLAYAKINLGLYIVARRPDGYHDIETVFCRIGIADRITFSPHHDINVTATSPEVPGNASNICHKAAILLRDHLRTDEGVHIHIEKHVPVGAGLGGGSSDAATVLHELPAFWNKSIAPGDQFRMALQLGSDVPYFLREGAAIGRGRGEDLEYFPLDIPYSILLCNPRIHVSTAWAYGRIRPGTAGKPHNLRNLVTEGMLHPEVLQDLRNDFENVVFESYPLVRQIKEEILHWGASFAMMSGSGSTIFGLFQDAEVAENLAIEFAGRGYKAFVTPPHFMPGASST